jgi:peroxiredoxin
MHVNFTKVIISCYMFYYSIFEKKQKKNFAMKREHILLLLSILISSVSYCQGKKVDSEGYIVKVGDKAPDFTIKEAGGKSYRLSDLKGKVVMLQFTASWCSVCRTEMPFIEKEIWQGKKADGLIVIGIDRDEPVDKVLQFRKDIAITYPLALDPGADIFGLYADKEAGVTRNVIIDRKGKIIFLTRLYERDEFEQMKKVIFAQLSSK